MAADPVDICMNQTICVFHAQSKHVAQRFSGDIPGNGWNETRNIFGFIWRRCLRDFRGGVSHLSACATTSPLNALPPCLNWRPTDATILPIYSFLSLTTLVPSFPRASSAVPDQLIRSPSSPVHDQVALPQPLLPTHTSPSFFHSAVTHSIANGLTFSPLSPSSAYKCLI